ncbi:hypothetical protein AB0M47_04895 [Hamadaea sp. NPDC051192]|uniref:hypothetical protein n=1 Tax=Hamadaea sp. NPDC051192 TaxID=3154940 RepID=UPI0034477D7E
MRIGYSMWGFLGNGVADADAPDGAQAYRRSFLDQLQAQRHEVVLLQRNRDRLDAGDDQPGFHWDPTGLPRLDALILEWRWSIEGRNTTPCGSLGHTCDLHRQTELLDRYTHDRGTPTLIWDLDRRLAADDPLRKVTNVAVGEVAFLATPGAYRLPCPVPDRRLDSVDPKILVRRVREPLVYVGHQNDRDDHFGRFFAPAAHVVQHQVVGRWTETRAWPHVTFTGPAPHHTIDQTYGQALATVLLSPERFWRVGHMTTRWWQALLAGCLPLIPAETRGTDLYLPSELHVRDGQQVIDQIAWLWNLAGTKDHIALLEACLARLQPYRSSKVARHALRILRDLS